MVAGLAWVTLLACYAAQGTLSNVADFRDRTFSPFISLAPVTGMLLAAGLAEHAFAEGRVLVVAFLAVTLITGGLLMPGRWRRLNTEQAAAGRQRKGGRDERRHYRGRAAGRGR